MKAGDDNWLVVVGILRKTWKSWARMTRILDQEGAYLRISGMFFKSILQSVLLLGSETWVLTPRIEHALISFQHRVTQRITRG